MNVFVGSPAFALGDVTNTVEESEAEGRLVSPARLLREAGFDRHHRCSAGMSSYDLAHRAVGNIRDGLKDVTAIVYSTCIPANGSVGSEEKYRISKDVKHLMDFPASRLQADFGLDRAAVFGLNQQACTGMLGSLRLARALLQAEPQQSSILCVTADRFPEGALYEQSYSLISDGAAACIVSRAPSAFRLLACHSITNGALSAATDEEAMGSFFSYAHRVVQETLQIAELNPGDIAHVVAQNMNHSAWKILSRLLGIDFDRVRTPSLATVGHVISGDNIINLNALMEDNGLRKGDKLLLFMAGYGLNWQCVILESMVAGCEKISS